MKLSKSSLLQLGGPSAMKHSQLLNRLMEGIQMEDEKNEDGKEEV